MSIDRAGAVRPSDAERERVVSKLRDAAVQGRLTFGELAQRIERAYASETTDELEAVLAELPEAPATHPERTRWIVAVMSGSTRKGRWRPATRTTAFALMGGIELDLRDAIIEDDHLTFTAIALMGGVEIIVPEGVDVRLDGFALLSRNELRTASGPKRPRSPVLVMVNAYSFMGRVDVADRYPEENRGAWGHFHLSFKKRRDLPH